MIAVLGVTEDDILYFKAKADIKETIAVYGSIKGYRGSIFQEDVILCPMGYGNHLSAIATAVIIARYEPYIVFNIGSVASFSEQLKQGDLFIADRCYLADVDFSAPKLAPYGQIPGRPSFFVGDTSLNCRAESLAYELTSRYIQRGYLLSGDVFYMDKAPLEAVVRSHFLREEGLMAYDSDSGGVALACDEAKTSLLTLKAVAYQIGSEEQRLTWVRKGLEMMPTIGKIITRFLIEKENR